MLSDASVRKNIWNVLIVFFLLNITFKVFTRLDSNIVIIELNRALEFGHLFFQ